MNAGDAPTNGPMRLRWTLLDGRRREATLSEAYADGSLPLPQFAQLAVDEGIEALESLAQVHVRRTDKVDGGWRAKRQSLRQQRIENAKKRFNRREGDAS